MRRFLQNEWTRGIAINLASTLILVALTAFGNGFRITSIPLYVPIAAVLASFGATALLLSNRRVRLYYTREDAYRAACETVKSAQPRKSDNVIWIESLSRITDPKKREERRHDAIIGEYDAAIRTKILSPEWRVRRLVNVPSIEMLKHVVDTYIDPFQTARYYQVRALVPGFMTATLGPLIVGENDVLISVAQDDTMARACIHIHDKTIVSLIKDHYQALWETDTVVLRDSDGKNEAGIALARDRLTGLPTSTDTSQPDGSSPPQQKKSFL